MKKINTALQDSFLFESKKLEDSRGFLWRHGIKRVWITTIYSR